MLSIHTRRHTYPHYDVYIISKLIVISPSRERHRRRRAKGWCAGDVGGVAAVREYARTFGIYMGAGISGHLTCLRPTVVRSCPTIAVFTSL